MPNILERESPNEIAKKSPFPKEWSSRKDLQTEVGSQHGYLVNQPQDGKNASVAEKVITTGTNGKMYCFLLPPRVGCSCLLKSLLPYEQRILETQLSELIASYRPPVARALMNIRALLLQSKDGTISPASCFTVWYCQNAQLACMNHMLPCMHVSSQSSQSETLWIRALM